MTITSPNESKHVIKFFILDIFQSQLKRYLFTRIVTEFDAAKFLSHCIVELYIIILFILLVIDWVKICCRYLSDLCTHKTHSIENYDAYHSALCDCVPVVLA